MSGRPILAAGLLCGFFVVEQWYGDAGNVILRVSSLPATCVTDDAVVKTGVDAGIYVCQTTNTWVRLSRINEGGGGGVPVGALIFVDTGACPTGYAEVTALDGRTILNTLNAHADVGTTGGADSVTPTFTGTAGTVPAETITWPVSVPSNSGGGVNAHSGTAVADHASHTHDYSTVIAHTHTQAVNSGTTGGLSGYTPDTSTSTSTTSGYSTGSTGSATGTTVGPSAVLTHSVTQPAAHVFTEPTIAWPVSVPTNGTVSFTPSGTVSAVDTRSAFLRLIPCKKT